jgi:deoxyhypusine synthase
MRNHKALRLSLAAMLCGGTLLSAGCGDLLRRSIRDGAVALIVGSATGYFNPADLSNLLTNMFTGGFTGGWGGSGNTNWPFTWPGTSQGT